MSRQLKALGERLLGFFASILELAELEGGRRETKRDPLSPPMTCSARC